LIRGYNSLFGTISNLCQFLDAIGIIKEVIRICGGMISMGEAFKMLRRCENIGYNNKNNEEQAKIHHQ